MLNFLITRLEALFDWWDNGFIDRNEFYVLLNLVLGADEVVEEV